MSKKAELSLLTFILGFVVLLGIFSAVFMFMGYFVNGNNITVTTMNETFHEVDNIVADLNDNYSIDVADQISQQNANITGGNTIPEQQSFEASNLFSLKSFEIMPKMVGVISTAMQEIGIPPMFFAIISIIILTTSTYLVIRFMRNGQ
jgi:hypothetical protein